MIGLGKFAIEPVTHVFEELLVLCAERFRGEHRARSGPPWDHREISRLLGRDPKISLVAIQRLAVLSQPGIPLWALPLVAPEMPVMLLSDLSPTGLVVPLHPTRNVLADENHSEDRIEQGAEQWRS